MFLALIALLWIAYKLGKEDGKWGLLIFIGIVFLIGLVMATLK
jgi:hypothetical protein